MRGELVALDLETTGLDPQQDDIIEIGAVRLRDGEVIDSYETMVNPGKPIPAQTTYITGIRQEDVANAPRIQKVLPQLAALLVIPRSSRITSRSTWASCAGVIRSSSRMPSSTLTIWLR
ncbi:3'-5' exonuclease [bacterium]|nr:3'-5' exonuclease [bacterium]